MNEEERRKGGLDTLNGRAGILYSVARNPKHKLGQRKEKSKTNYIELKMNPKK